jgi:DNA-binding beta-propeller fold protein YncE
VASWDKTDAYSKPYEKTSFSEPVPAGGEPIWVTVDSSGQFVYVANHGTNNVSMYTITPGSGTLMPRGTVPAGVHPWWVTVAPSGQFVYVANASSPDAQGNPVGDVSMYEITGTGTLRPLGTVRAGKGPVAVTTKEVLV